MLQDADLDEIYKPVVSANSPHLQTNFQESSSLARQNDESLLLNQDITQAGFRKDGTYPKSITKAVTAELEYSRSEQLGDHIRNTLHRRDYERWSWESWTRMNIVFLHSPPDALGHLSNDEFRIAFATYIGQECPVLGPLAGRHFGRQGAVMDAYGANLAAASLPGPGPRALHNNLQALLQSMMKLGGIYSEKEAPNFLFGKV